MILAIRTDKPEAELYLYDGEARVTELHWEAHRQLAATIHAKIDELLNQAELQLADLTKVVVYAGPGSFTGLRIGVSVANALGYGLEVPVAAASGENWLSAGLEDSGSRTPATVVYGSAPHITEQKK